MSDFMLIEAANGAKPRVSGTAYSGGKLNLPGWRHPVVVDLAGMEIPDTVPLLTNHENKTDARVGMIHASVKNNALEIAGEIISDSKDAADIVSQGQAGADWQLSIGADVKECELVKSSREVNGQSVDGPFYHVKKSTLREVSVVAVGADAKTVMKIAASFNLTNQGEETMSKEVEVQAAAQVTEPVVAAVVAEIKPEVVASAAPGFDASAVANEAIQAERTRVKSIKDICNGEFPDVEASAISDGLTLNETREKVLAAYRAKKPSTSVNVIVKSNREVNQKTLEAAFCLRAGVLEDTVVKAYGEQTVEMAAPDRDISIRELMGECMRIEGMNVGRSFDNDNIVAAFSTVSLPGILSNVANKKLQQSYDAQPIIGAKLCSTGDLNDFKESERLRLTDVGDLLPVAADGEIKDGGQTEESAKNQLETYGKKFCLTRKMIINDDLGAFMKVPTAMGNRAARLIDHLFFTRLLKNPTQGDGSALFHATHKNLLTGATSALSADSLQSGIQKFLDQTDADGQPISIEASYLLVPTALKFKAIELTRGAAFIATGDTDVVRPALNALADENLQVVSSPYLGNSAYDGASQTGWYLFGDPRQVETFEIGYLKGKRTPTVERGDTDFNTLGMWFRVYFDLGVREQGFRGMVKSNGAA